MFSGKFHDCNLVCASGEPSVEAYRCVTRKDGKSYWKMLPEKSRFHRKKLEFLSVGDQCLILENFRQGDNIGCIGARVESDG